MLGWLRARAPTETRGLDSRANRGQNDTQKVPVELSGPPRREVEGGLRQFMAAREIAAIAPTRRIG